MSWMLNNMFESKARPKTSWIKQSFMLPVNSLSMEMDRIYRTYTTADAKFVDTTIGGTWEINPLPQYTRFADVPRSPSSVSYAGTNFTGNQKHKMTALAGGLGRAYSEIYHDNARRVHFRAGVAKFNTLTRYFGNFFSAKQANAARTARFDRGFLAAVAGGATSLLTLPLQPVVFIGKVLNYWTGTPSTKYYYLKPAMEMYWMSMGNIVNGIWAAMNTSDLSFVSERAPLLGEDDVANYTGLSEWDQLRAIMPDVFGPMGYIDVNAISTKAERLRMRFQEKIDERLKGLQGQELERFLLDLGNRDPSRRPQILDPSDGKRPETFAEYLTAYNNTEFGGNEPGNVLMFEQGKDEDSGDAAAAYEAEVRAGHYTAKMRDASEWITYRVEDIGSVTESFSNTTKESGIAGTINSMSASSRDKRFNLADGNVGPILGGIVQTITDIVSSVTDSLSIDGIAALAGSAFADIPDQWDDSSASINDMSFTIQLRAPYNNPVSKLQNIIIPLSGLLALTLPLSTGQQSFTSPFLIECISPGQGHIRLGIVESLNITRAVGDVKWAGEMGYMGVDVTINIKDLSNVVHMPIGITGGIMGKAAVAGTNLLAGGDAAGAVANQLAAWSEETYNSDSLFNDYLGTLASLRFEDMFHKTAMWSINRRRTALSYMRTASDTWIPSINTKGFTADAIRAFTERTGRE